MLQKYITMNYYRCEKLELRENAMVINLADLTARIQRKTTGKIELSSFSSRILFSLK